MNGKTAKLIRKWCADSGNDPNQLKRLWKSIPRNQRGNLSREMKKELAPDAYGYDIVKTEDGKTLAVSKNQGSGMNSGIATMTPIQ